MDDIEHSFLKSIFTIIKYLIIAYFVRWILYVIGLRAWIPFIDDYFYFVNHYIILCLDKIGIDLKGFAISRFNF